MLAFQGCLFSFDYRGVIPIEILKRLEESCQLRIGDMFDYVIGVSSGAVTAFLLSIAKASTEECEQLYKDLSSTVFGRNRFLGTSNLVLNHAFYDTERWIKMLRYVFYVIILLMSIHKDHIVKS